MNHSSFSINKNKLLQELNNIAKVVGRKNKQSKNVIAELTITDNLLTIVLPGITKSIECLTYSSVKATIGFYYFKDIIETSNNHEIECNIFDNELRIGGTAIHLKTTFFENDSILRSIQLPVNYTPLHLLQLEHKGFTIEELRFNNLEFDVYEAKRALNKNVQQAFDILRLYGITEIEIQELIDTKIKE
jgi:hypothetical protein